MSSETSQVFPTWTNRTDPASFPKKRALEETKAVFPSLRERIANSREKLQAQLDSGTDENEIEEAKKVLAEAIESQKDDPDSAHPDGQ